VRPPINLDKQCGLIVVDMQEDFMDGGPLGIPGARDLIEPINRVVSLFDKKGLAIFFTRDWHPSNHCSFKDYGGKWPVHCVSDTKGASFASGLLLPQRYQVISKATDAAEDAYSGFKGTDLGKLISNMDVKKVFLVGVATEYCVFETALDAIGLGLETFIIGDCISGVEEGKAQEALHSLEEAGAFIIKSSDIK